MHAGIVDSGSTRSIDDDEVCKLRQRDSKFSGSYLIVNFLKQLLLSAVIRRTRERKRKLEQRKELMKVY